MAGDAAQAQQHSSQALDLAQANGMETLTTQGRIDIGNVYLIKGNAWRPKNFNEALRLAQLYKGRRSQARAYLSLSSLRSRQGDAEAARQYFQRALPFYEQGGYRKEVSQAYAILGRVQNSVGDYDSARKTFERQLEMAQQVGDPQSIALAHEGLAKVALNQQNFPEALSHYNTTYDIHKSMDAKLNMGYTANNQAEALWQLGRYDEKQERR